MSVTQAALTAHQVFLLYGWQWSDEDGIKYDPSVKQIKAQYQFLEAVVDSGEADYAESGRLKVAAEFLNHENADDGVLHSYYVFVGNDLED